MRRANAPRDQLEGNGEAYREQQAFHVSANERGSRCPPNQTIRRPSKTTRPLTIIACTRPPASGRGHGELLDLLKPALAS
jgi:hypothetical protein